MIKYAMVFLFSISALSAQENVNLSTTSVNVGDVFEIGEPDTNSFKHIKFPRANFIIKRGGIANYESVKGNKVVVTSVKAEKDGSIQIKIKREDGRRFFGSHLAVSANFEEALSSGELQAI